MKTYTNPLAIYVAGLAAAVAIASKEDSVAALQFQADAFERGVTVEQATQTNADWVSMNGNGDTSHPDVPNDHDAETALRELQDLLGMSDNGEDPEADQDAVFGDEPETCEDDEDPDEYDPADEGDRI